MNKLALRLPLFLSPMAGVCSPALAAAVAESGGLGALGLGATPSPAAIQTQMREVKHLLNKKGNCKYQVNFFCHQPVAEVDPVVEKEWIQLLAPKFKEANSAPPDKLSLPYKSFLEDDGSIMGVVLSEKPDAVSFHFGLPTSKQLDALKLAGIVTISTATCVKEAELAASLGIDIIVAQGVSAGGHRGTFSSDPRDDPNTDTEELLLRLSSCKSLSGVSIVAAGGIASRKQVEQLLSLGASAVQIGTGFIHCRESLASDAYRSALFEGCGFGPRTRITNSISGRPARSIVNKWHLEIDNDRNLSTLPPYPFAYDIAKKLGRASVEAGDEFSFSNFFAGTGCERQYCRQMNEAASDVVERMFGSPS